jgi:hypothetical protein
VAECVTYTGRTVDYERPETTDVDYVDLQVQLSRMCRYNGAIQWSVLQHLALCTHLAQPHGALVQGYAAAHDLHEAYIGDIAKPIIRGTPLWEPWMKLEETWASHVHRQMGLNWPPPAQVRELVHAIDMRCLYIETCIAGGSEALREHPTVRRGGLPLSKREADLAALVHGQSPPALWNTVHSALVAAREAW